MWACTAGSTGNDSHLVVLQQAQQLLQARKVAAVPLHQPLQLTRALRPPRLALACRVL